MQANLSRTYGDFLITEAVKCTTRRYAIKWHRVCILNMGKIINDILLVAQMQTDDINPILVAAVSSFSCPSKV